LPLANAWKIWRVVDISDNFEQKCINHRKAGYINPAFLLRIISTQFYLTQIK